MLSTQEYFDKTVNHLLKQGVRSTSRLAATADDTPGCAYRGQDGTSCAIGCHIPDELYETWMEGESAYSLMHHKGVNTPQAVKDFLMPGEVRSNNYSLNEKLQAIHDNVAPKDWESTLIRLAVEFGLECKGLVE